MKRSEVLDIIDGILIDHELPVLEGISKEILSKLESIGFRLTEEIDYGHVGSELQVKPYDPEEGWEAWLEEQDKKDQARDFKVYSDGSSWKRSQSIALDFLQGKSFEEIAEYYNVTRERVRQCVAKERRRYQKSQEENSEK